MGNFLLLEKSNKTTSNPQINKKVTFDIFNDVIIIPNHLEMNDCVKKIWWTHFELNLFRENALNEFYGFCVNNPKMTVKNIKKILYQPNYENIKSLFL